MSLFFAETIARPSVDVICSCRYGFVFFMHAAYYLYVAVVAYADAAASFGVFFYLNSVSLLNGRGGEQAVTIAKMKRQFI